MEPAKSNEAYARVRRDIVTGVIAPNETIVEVTLGGRYGLGRTPVREALKQLSNEQLVVWRHRQSPYVPGIDAAQVRFLYEARAIFETQIAALAAERITSDATDDLDGLVAHEADLLRSGMVYDAVETALRFHQGIAEATSNPFLFDASTRINTCALRIWHDTATAEQSPAHEHSDIVDALRRHDPDDAVSAVQQHATNAYHRCVRALFRHGRGAADLAERTA